MTQGLGIVAARGCKDQRTRHGRLRTGAGVLRSGLAEATLLAKMCVGRTKP